MSDKCIFCKIVRHETEADTLHEAEDFIIFKDIQPQAPAHILAVPKEHIPSLNQIDASHDDLVGRMVRQLKSVAADMGIAESGYRILANTGPDAGQQVKHLHWHLLGGKLLPPLG